MSHPEGEHLQLGAVDPLGRHDRARAEQLLNVGTRAPKTRVELAVAAVHPGGGSHVKVPQLGRVIIQDRVEIGANTTIDRGGIGDTVIGEGTKIDNLVQIGHNVTIGEHSVLCAQVGISGSTRIGNYTTLAGQVGLAGHIQIGSRVTVAAQSGIMNDIPDGEKWLGTPGQPDRQMKRVYLALQRLPELLRRVSELEKQLGATAKPK